MPTQIVKKAVRWTIEYPQPIHTFFPLLGFDPGTVNLGIAKTLQDEAIDLYELTLERNKDAALRIMEIYFLMNDLKFDMNQSIVVIEGASYGNQFRQVELAEMRAAITIWSRQRGARKVSIIPPNSLRKEVFGKATITAHDYWDDTEIDRDALAALSCLYYADKKGI